MGTIATVTNGADTFSVYALTANVTTDAKSFFNFQLGAGKTAWDAASSSDRNRALAMASDWIDRAVGANFSGTKTVATQAREWPRDSATCYSVIVASGTTPDDIANAGFWLTGQILEDASTAEGSGTGSNIKEVKAGSALVSFFSQTIGSSTDTRLPIVAQDYVKCYFVLDPSLSGTASGVTTSSAFDATNYTRIEGYS